MTENNETELASIQAPVQAFRDVIEKSSLSGYGDPLHSDIYLNIHPSGQVNVVVASPGGVVLTYCTFTDNHLDSISSEQDDGTQAIIPVAKFLSYLDFSSDGGDVQLSFRGQKESALASIVEIYGALNTRLMLPASDSILEEVPTGLPKRFDSDNVFQSENKDKGGLPTKIDVDVAEIRKIIEVVNYDENTTFFPITVEDSELTLEVGTEGERDAVWGMLTAKNVEGPDVANHYIDGFEQVFGTLSGDVVLQTAPGGAPLCVVQDVGTGMVLRHVIGNVSKHRHVIDNESK
jgi:hypothetical protein